MALQLDQVVEGVGAAQLTGVNQTHEQVTDSSAVQRLIEEGVLAVQDGFLKRALHDVVVERRASLPQEKRQLGLVIH